MHILGLQAEACAWDVWDALAAATPRRHPSHRDDDCCSTLTHRNAFAFGENPSGPTNPFIGTGDFALSATTDATAGDSSWALFLFHWAFSAAAATIMAGAIAERMTMGVYLGYTCMMTTLVRRGGETGGAAGLCEGSVYRQGRAGRVAERLSEDDGP